MCESEFACANVRARGASVTRAVRNIGLYLGEEEEDPSRRRVKMEPTSEIGDERLRNALPHALRLLQTLHECAEAKNDSNENDATQDPSPSTADDSAVDVGTANGTKSTLTDAMVMQVWETLYVLFTFKQLLQESITRALMDGSNKIPENVLQVRKTLVDSITNMEAAISDAMDKAVDVMTLKPRLVRLAEKLELTRQEVRAWMCIVLGCIGVSGPADSVQDHLQMAAGLGRRSEMYTLREFAGFDTPADLLHFLSPSKPLMKQGLLEVDDEFSVNYSDSKFRSPREVLKALYGGAITLDEFMTVDGTALAEVLSEEPGSVIDTNGIDVTTHDDGMDDQVDQANLPSGIPADSRNKHDDMLGLLSELRMGPDMTTPEAEDSGQAGGETVLENGETLDEIDRAAADEDDEEDDDAKDLGPYKTDLDYLEDGFTVIQEACKVYNFKEKSTEEDRYQSTKRPVEALQREAEAKQRKAFSRFSRRLSRTRAAGGPLPRLELLVNKLKLDHFERMVILTLVGATLSQPVRKALRADPSSRYDGICVSKLLRIHCNGELKEEVAARFHFYRRGRLVRSGIITIDQPYGLLGDLGECIVELDHMVLDYVAGLQTEIDELMDSARCYTPNVSMDSVVLPKEMKDMVLKQAENFELFRKLRKAVGLDDIVRYGRGLTLLFHGRSGTGKTMFANALATHLKRKLLVVDFATLNNSKFSGSDAYRIVFREATIHRAIVFFDECDEILESRDRGGKGAVALALREMEVFDGIMILATNRAQMLDEAVHRRISLSLDFSPPDVELRLDIWRKHVPKGLKLGDDVDLGTLALEYELSGGLIKNAILQALSSAVGRLRTEKAISQDAIDQSPDFETATGISVSEVEISMSDLRNACRLQARGHLKRAKLERRMIPTSGLDALVASEKTMTQLREIVMVEKVRGLMSTRWGFKSRVGRSNCVLMLAPQGCGKSFAAACVGFETGRPLQTISMSEMEGLRDTGAQIGDVFAEASIAGAVVVIEQAEQLLFEAAQPDRTSSPGIELLYHVQTYNGLIIMCCTTAKLPSEAGWDIFQPVPNRLTALLSYVVALDKPNTAARLRLWKQLTPKATPLADEVTAKLPQIAQKYEFTGARINSCIRRAAAAAAMRANRAALSAFATDGSGGEGSKGDKPAALVTFDDVLESCETETTMMKATAGLQQFGGLYV